MEDIYKLLVAAGREILRIYNSTSIKKELKEDNSYVTEADRISSKLINLGLKKIYPFIPVVDEENPIPSYP